MSSQTVKFKNIKFQHGQGATNNFLFFARTPGQTQRSIAKVGGVVSQFELNFFHFIYEKQDLHQHVCGLIVTLGEQMF
jgi:hypothetical protein